MKVISTLLIALCLFFTQLTHAAPWAHADVLDNGPNYIKNNCNKWVAVLSYTAGDTYATVTTAGNIIAEVTVNSTDFTNGSSGNNRTLTTASGKQDASANNSGDPTALVCVDTVNFKVLWKADENSANNVTTGNPVTFPSLVYTSNQPT